MSEKKVVIRLNYSLDQGPSEPPEPEMITEWNLRRIATALLILLFLVGGAFWFMWKSGIPTRLSEDASQAEKAPRVALSMVEAPGPVEEKTTDEESQLPEEPPTRQQEAAPGKVLSPSSSVRSARGSSEEKSRPTRGDPRVVQAVLSKLVYHRQPVGLIENTVYARPDKAVGVFYYTQLKSMRGNGFPTNGGIKGN